MGICGKENTHSDGESEENITKKLCKEIRKMLEGERERGWKGERNRLLSQKTTTDVALCAAESSPSLGGQAVLYLPSVVLNASTSCKHARLRVDAVYGGRGHFPPADSHQIEKINESLFPEGWDAHQRLCAHLAWADAVFKEHACCMWEQVNYSRS